MGVDIQSMLDRPSKENKVLLPIGEYEGPFTVNSPCIIIGNGATLWAKKGPVLHVKSQGVSIQNLRLEITEESIDRQDLNCITSDFKDVKFTNVEVMGNIQGIPNEEGNWDLPKILNLDLFKAEAHNSFTFELNIPTHAKIKSTIKDMKLSPDTLQPGRNKVTIETNKMKNGTFLYGELEISSLVTHRVFLTGQASEDIKDAVVNKLIETTVKTKLEQGDVIVPSAEVIAPTESNHHKVIQLKKGERDFIHNFCGKDIALGFSCNKIMGDMEIDAYTFLLDENDQCNNEKDLVFFGNLESQCKGVRYIENSENCNENRIIIEFDKIPAKIKKIAVGYAIYGEDPSHNFSKAKEPCIHLYGNHMEKARFLLADLYMEKTVVGIEFYRYKNEWKFNAVGAGYLNGLARLCESYGLEVHT